MYLPILKFISISISISISITTITIVGSALFFLFSPRYYKGKVSGHYNGFKFFDPDFVDKNIYINHLKWFLTRRSTTWPNKITNNQFDTPPNRVMGDNLRVSNIGHATFLIQTEGLNILTDPVWSDRTSPFSFIGPRRRMDPGIKFEDLPPIDLVWISHNHYDHLDIATIDKLWKMHKPRIIVPLGNDTIIQSHNNRVAVEAYDWGNSIEIKPAVHFHLEPMQHWSGRGLLDRNKALWAALIIETSGGNIYFVGDSGYGNGRYFKRAKEKFGSFRLAFIPIGAYDPAYFMAYNHMDPEDAVRAHIDLGMPYTVPSHYDVFDLADEDYGAALLALEQAKQKLKVGSHIKVMEIGTAWQVPVCKRL